MVECPGVTAQVYLQKNLPRVCSPLQILSDNLPGYVFEVHMTHKNIPWVYLHMSYDLQKHTTGIVTRGFAVTVTPDLFYEYTLNRIGK